MLQQVPTRAFHVMAKPSGSDCNLNCDYCFYLEKQSLYREKPVTHMDDDTLEAYVRHYIAASETQTKWLLPGRAANQRYSGWIFTAEPWRYRRNMVLAGR